MITYSHNIMKKIILLAVMCMAFVNAVFSQHFTHGIGGGFFVEEADYRESRVGFGFTYSPKFSFAETKKTSFSVGIPLTIGASASTDNYDDTYTYYGSYVIQDAPAFMLRLPLVLNFNLGAGAVKGNRSKLGFFAGGGMAYLLGEVNNYVWDDNGYLHYNHQTKSTVGPLGNIGMRIALGQRRRHNLEIKASYVKGLTAHKPDVYGLECLFNF